MVVRVRWLRDRARGSGRVLLLHRCVRRNPRGNAGDPMADRVRHRNSEGRICSRSRQSMAHSDLYCTKK